MVDYSQFAPARPPQSPTEPTSSTTPSSNSSSSLAPRFNHLRIDQHYNASQYQHHQQPSPRGVGAGGQPPQLANLQIHPQPSQSYPRSPTSPASYGGGYSAQDRPRPNLGGGVGSNRGPVSPVGSAGGGGGGGYNQTSSRTMESTGGGGSPNRVPRKSSLAATGGMSASNSLEQLPPLPTSSSSMHFPQHFGGGGGGDSIAQSQRDSSGGEAVFNGAALSSTSATGDSRNFTSPPPQPRATSSPLSPPLPPPVPSTSTSSSNRAPAPSSTSSKKANPLEDLIATETLYVEDLGVVIKRVAAAWSRSNFPPPALDTMFRAVEAVYRINKTLLGKLLEIGPNPSSPKALGDLLMRWISDIEPAYSRYGTTLLTSFDTYEPVQSNPKLSPILDTLSWPSTLPPIEQYPPQLRKVSLDRLFELPVYRIKYYQKLYAKLLRSTQEGRSDHALLVDANQKLAKLEKLAEEGKSRTVGGGGGDEERERQSVVGEESSRGGGGPPRLELRTVPNQAVPMGERTSGESGRLESPSDGSMRSSSATGASTANTTVQTHREPPLRVEELERRLNTDRTLDIFSMQPRKCKLQMQPPSLTFTRQLRKASSVTISFYPASDPSHRQVVHPHAYVILLTDLFLLCDWTSPNESTGQDLTLLYPPLAGKHLKVTDTGDRNELEVSIMGKERLTIRFPGGPEEAREWKFAMEEAARFGASHTLSLRADSTSSGQGRPALSPISPPLGSNDFRTGPLSPTLGQPSQGNGRGLAHSPEPMSPASNYSSRQDPSYNALAAPQSFPQPPPPQNQNPGFDLAPAVARPDRNASMGRNQSPNGFVPSPSSSSFQHDQLSNGGSRGASPLRPDFAHQQPQPTQQYGSGRQSPHHGQNLQSDFNPSRPLPGSNEPTGSYSRPSSRQSQNSLGSASNRTDRSSGYPEPPPPLPKERSYNGLNISGRGGPIYPTSMRTDPGDSRSISGHSDYLSPHNSVHRSKSAEGLRVEPPQHYRMPSQTLSEDRSTSNPAFAPSVGNRIAGEDDSPPSSPVNAQGPQKTSIVADMRCKIFLQQYHSQWKSLGTAKLKLYLSKPSNMKQIVVDSDKGKGKTLISTIVLTDGVERVGKTGVAIELSDQGDRTGIIYMLQMKTEQSATGLFEQLLVGSDRAR